MSGPKQFEPLRAAIEATAVEPVGGITYADVGLWDEAAEAALARVLDSDMPRKQAAHRVLNGA